jgi:hypothetical protein
MRALRIILTALLALIAVTAGLFVAATVAVSALAVYVGTRLLGNKGFRVTGSTTIRRSTRPPNTRRSSDAIDVTATEIAQEPARSLPAGSEKEDAHFRA